MHMDSFYSFVFITKTKRKTKGHCVSILKTLPLSLLAHPEKGRATVYLIPPSSVHACIHPFAQPDGLWAHCGAWGQCCGQAAPCSHGWAERQRGRLAHWTQTGVWFRGVSCEGWISYTCQCSFKKKGLGNRERLHRLWLSLLSTDQNVCVFFFLL